MSRSSFQPESRYVNKNNVIILDVRSANVLHFETAWTILNPMKVASPLAFYKTLGARIRELRGNRSQEQLALEVGLTRTSIVNIEAGRQKLLVHNLFKIAEILGVSPSQLLLPLENNKRAKINIFISGNLSEDVNKWVERSVTKAIEKQK